LVDTTNQVRVPISDVVSELQDRVRS
jgi:hypothetical protein